MRYAVIDIGSNTVKIHIFNADMSQVHYTALPVGLISYVKDNVMTDEGTNKLIHVLNQYKSIAAAHQTDEIYYIATASLRGIDNQDSVLDTIFNQTGIKIEIISGYNEALYSFEGLKYGMGSALAQSGFMIDMGGGSTEILGFRDGKLCDTVSLPMGCLKLFNMFANETTKIYNHVDELLSDVPWISDYGDTVYLIGGTARSLALYGKLNKYADLTEMLDRIGNDFELIKKVTPDRANTLIPGLIAYCRLLQRMKTDNIVVTQVGIRDGYMMCKLNGE
jgi:Exopolyphosphatase